MSEEQTDDVSATHRSLEPSQDETGMMIADQLNETEDKRRRYIGYLVRTLGRTQARQFCDEVLAQSEHPEGEVSQKTRSEVYFELACTKGQPKPGKVLRPFNPLPSRKETAEKIIERLNETGMPQRRQIHSIVRALGIVQAWALMIEAFEIDAGDGMLVPDGSRRRTVGGIFFHLVYTKGVPEPGMELKRIFPKSKPKTDESDEPKAVTAKPEPVIIFGWEDRIAVITEAETQKGTANVKITLVGRPGKIVDQGQCIVTVMEASKVPALPKGLPVPPSVPTKYTVSIGSKQWKKVAEAITDPEDVLIIEGYPILDSKTGSIAVFATNTTTKKLQMAQKTKQQATV